MEGRIAPGAMLAGSGGDMLVDGACEKGHALICSMHGGRITGTVVRGALRDKCPTCGSPLNVHLESGTLPAMRASDPHVQAAMKAVEQRQGKKR
jgi:hypothetical protein